MRKKTEGCLTHFIKHLFLVGAPTVSSLYVLKKTCKEELLYYLGIKFVAISILQPGIFCNTGDCIAPVYVGYNCLHTELVDRLIKLNNLRQEVSVEQTFVGL